MKFLRFKNKADSLNNDLKTKSGFLDDEGKVIELKGDILDYFNKDIKSILDNREANYSKADNIIDTENMLPQNIVKRIVEEGNI